MRIAMTGATGFVGNSSLQAILAAGHSVSALVRKPQVHDFGNSVDVTAGDLSDDNALAKWASEADCIVHVAGAIAAPSESEFFKVNFLGTRRVFAVAAAAGVKRMIYISSLTARMPSISPYAASKRAAEDWLLDNAGDMELIIIRPCAVYGPGDKATLPLLAALQKQVAIIPGRATSRFSLIHVSDLAKIICDAVTSQQTGIFEVDDLAGGHSWAELARVSAEHVGLPKIVTYLPQSMAHIIAALAEIWAGMRGRTSMITRAKMRELYHDDWVVRGENWPRENFKALPVGLPETIDWYCSHGWLPPVGAKAKSKA